MNIILFFKENLFNNVKKLLEIQNNKTRALKASVCLWREIQKEKVVLIVWLLWSCLLLLSFDWLILLSGYLVI